MNTIRKQARFAGLLYLLLGVTAPIGLLYVPVKLIVRGDAAATAENLRSSESLLRLGIGSELIHQALVIYVVLALYRLFKPVNVSLARHLVSLGALVSVPIMFVNVLNEVAALTLAQGPEFLSVLDPLQRDALAYLFMRLHGQGVVLASVFWGLWLFPFGLLVIRSGFIPKAFGYLLFAAGAGYLASSFARLVVPPLVPLVDRLALPLQIAEVPILFWLAIWGARGPKASEPAAA